MDNHRYVYIEKGVEGMDSISKIEKVPRGIQVKSRVKTWQVRGIWFQQLEH